MNSTDYPENFLERLKINAEEASKAFLLVAKECAKKREEENLKKIEEEKERRKRLAEEDERWGRWKRKGYYESAKRFALDLHSDQIPEIIQKQEKKKEGGGGGEEQSEFQIAREAIKERREEISTTTDMEIDLMVVQRKQAPSLMSLTARVLANNSEVITSLKHVPDHLRKNISSLVGDLGKVNARFMNLLIEDSPYEVCAKNCVDLEEEDLINILCDCNRVSLTVLKLDLCGRAMTDYTITEFLKRSPNKFPSLKTLSLQGAFCLTDNALALISESAPLLQFINLSYCSLLTCGAVKILAAKFRSTLRGLNIEGCQGIKMTDVFTRSLAKFESLNYLSVAGLENITDIAVLPFLTFRSSNLTDISLAFCNEVSDDCIWHIGRYCKKLEGLDISDLNNLTDKSLEYITEGCKSLKSVNFSGTRFSDEGIAAFLEVLGGSLNQLCLNKVRDVGRDTATSLAKVCRRLRYLDLSWCRRITAEELRRILICCSSLISLKLFGWTQVEDEFLTELSRLEVHIIGLPMTSLNDHLNDSYPTMNTKFF